MHPESTLNRHTQKLSWMQAWVHCEIYPTLHAYWGEIETVGVTDLSGVDPLQQRLGPLRALHAGFELAVQVDVVGLYVGDGVARGRWGRPADQRAASQLPVQLQAHGARDA